jgi:hypothetical protein
VVRYKLDNSKLDGVGCIEVVGMRDEMHDIILPNSVGVAI